MSFSHESFARTNYPPELNLRRVEPKSGKPTHDFPVFIVPGYGSSAKSYDPLMLALSEQGFIAICPQHKPGLPGEPRRLRMVAGVKRKKKKPLLATIQAGLTPNDSGKKRAILVTHSKGAM